MRKGSTRIRCVRGQHNMLGDNVYVRPGDGKRYCRACMKATRQYYYGTLSDGSDACFDPSRKAGNRTERTPTRWIAERHWLSEATGQRLLWSELFPPVFIDQCETDEAF